MRKVLTVSLLIAVIAALSISTAFAEYSVYDWWQNSLVATGGTGIDRGETNDFWCSFDATNSGGHYQSGLFHNGDTYADIRMEQAGFANSNTFGWFGWYDAARTQPINVSAPDRKNGTGEGIGLYEIFGGTSPITWSSYPPTTTWHNQMPAAWGFYMHSGDGNWYFSAPGSVSSLLGASGTYVYENYRMQVFDDPAGANSDSSLESDEVGRQWVLCWEDQYGTLNDHTDFDHDFSGIRPADGWGDGTPIIESNNNSNEPDYNDMVITFGRYSSDAEPGDPTPEPATWALLLATCAFGGLIRRRRRE